MALRRPLRSRPSVAKWLVKNDTEHCQLFHVLVYNRSTVCEGTPKADRWGARLSGWGWRGTVPPQTHDNTHVKGRQPHSGESLASSSAGLPPNRVSIQAALADSNSIFTFCLHCVNKDAVKWLCDAAAWLHWCGWAE